MATSGPVVETVSRKRLIPPAELEKEKQGRTTPEFWEFIEAMTSDMWAGDYLLYILREDPKPSLYGGTNTLEKCPGYIAMPDGTQVKLNSREDIELAIKQKYGGKAFRLILKKGSERISEGKCVNEAPPRFPDANPQATHALPNAGAQSDVSVATKAMDIVGNQQPEALRLAMDVLRSASEIVMRTSAPPAAAAAQSIEIELDRAFKAAMIKKMMDPPPDPVESFLKIRAALGGENGGSSNANALVERILSTAVDKLLNPAAAVSGRTTLLDLGREFIPVLGTTVRETMHEYRLSREADARIVEMQRGTQPPPQPARQPAQVIDLPAAAAAPVPVNSNPPPAPSQEVPAAPGLTFQQIEAHIAKIVKNVEYPVEEAVDRVLSFLYDTDPRIVGALLNPPSIDQRLSPGKQGLIQLFQYEPALQPCISNLPRLSEFLDKFIEAATEAEKVEANLRAAAPANSTAPPAAPNP